MKNLLYLTFLSFVTLATISTSALAEGDLCRNILILKSKTVINDFDASESFSQRLRDNPDNYWQYNLRQSVTSLDNNHLYPHLHYLTQHKGYVFGDAHAGNFVWLANKNELRYIMLDIKNAGVGPFIFDFNWLALTTQVVAKKSTQVETSFKQTALTLVDAYLIGLKNKSFAIPERIQNEISNESASSFLQREHEYAVSKSKKKRFKYRDTLLEIEDPITKELLLKQITNHIKKLSQNYEIIDIAVRPKDRGGSKDLTRYWALVTDQNGFRRIFEFKEVNQTSLALYETQKPHDSRYIDIYKFLWGEQLAEHRLVKIDNVHFMMRPKKVDILSVPYSQKTLEDYTLLMELSTLAAYEMGLRHGAQSGTDYIKYIEKNKEALIKELKRYSKEYKKQIKDELGEE